MNLKHAILQKMLFNFVIKIKSYLFAITTKHMLMKEYNLNLNKELKMQNKAYKDFSNMIIMIIKNQDIKNQLTKQLVH